MSKLESSRDFERELEALEELIEIERSASGPDSFVAELASRGLEGRRQELIREFDGLGDAYLPVQELDVFLTGRPVFQDEILSYALAKVLADLQDVLRSIVAADLVDPGRRGPYPDEVIERSQLRFAGSFAGSFGMRLRAADEQLEMELEEEGPLADAIESLIKLIEGKRDETSMLEALTPLGGRARSYFRTLLEDLSDVGADMEVEWARVGGSRRASVSAAECEEIVNVLSRVEEEVHETTEFGYLIGANIRRRNFEFAVAQDEVRVGKAEEGVLEAGVRLGQRYQADFQVTEVLDTGTGDARFRYRLVHLEEAPPAEQDDT